MIIKDRKLIALVVGVAYIVFLASVFFVDKLRTDKFVQGITGLLTALLVAIEIFILIPPPKDTKVPTALAIKVPVALASAAVFYYFLLPQILPFIFPPTNPPVAKIVKGTVYNERNERLKDATIRIGQFAAVSTNAEGNFVLEVPVTESSANLTISYGGVERELPIIDGLGKYVFNQILDVKTLIQKLDSTFWKEEDSQPCNRFKGNNYAVKMFVLKKDSIPKVDGFDELRLKVEYLGDGTIVRKETNGLTQVGGLENNPSGIDNSNPTLWTLPVVNENLKFTVAFCIGIQKNSKPPTVNDWDTAFWFEKVK